MMMAAPSHRAISPSTFLATTPAKHPLPEVSGGRYPKAGHSITEDPVADYSGSFSADCSGDIVAGEEKPVPSPTYRRRVRHHRKSLHPAGGTRSYGYIQTIRDPSNFLLDDGDTETFNNVPPGNYLVAEQDHFPDILTNLVCDDGASAVPSETYIGGNTPFDPDDEPIAGASDNVAIINLEPSETVRCTYTNAIPGSIRMQKVVPPGK
ncbi:MAG: hypothetical protein R3F53_15690 [Gammaproteobacteria bacterium]